MPDASHAPAEVSAQRFLIFGMDRGTYAVAAETVSEVIRAPAIARVPQAPMGLMGLANLRGTVLPIASLRGLLGHADAAAAEPRRVIVLTGVASVGLAVDDVFALVTVANDAIERRPAEVTQEPGEMLIGAFRTEGDAVAKILDLPGLLAKAFAPRVRSSGAAGKERAPPVATVAGSAEGGEKFVTFEVAGQEFALGLEHVHEIIQAPRTLTDVPRSEAVVLGLTGYRETLLPLLSLRGLLGFPQSATHDDAAKVIVTALGGARVGLVADRMRTLITADPALVEATPAMLAARTGGEAQIKAIYRGDSGRRLVSILAVDLLFREDVMARLKSGDAPAAEDLATGSRGDAVQVLVFRLGDDEFGLPIGVVDEVARVPEKVTRLPKTPSFLEGVTNLRGDVLPVIDQRRRFEMSPLASPEGRRLIVVRTQAHRAGLIVDSVSEVLRCDLGDILPAPALTGETTRLVNGVLNIEADHRLVLMLNPEELLTRAERGLLAVFQAGAEQAER